MLSFRQARNFGFGIIFFIIFSISLWAYISQEKTTGVINYIINNEQDKLNRWSDIANLISSVENQLHRDIIDHRGKVSPFVIDDLNNLHIKLYQLENDYPKEGLKAKNIRAELKPFKDAIIAYGQASEGNNPEALFKEIELTALDTAQRTYDAVYSAAEQVRGTIQQKNDTLIADLDVSGKYLIFGLLAGLFFVVSVGLVVGKSLTNPLIKLGKAMDNVAKGNLGYQIPLFHDKDIDGLAIAFNKMAKDLEASEDKKIVENMKYIENILNSMNDMLLVVSLDGLVKTVNFSLCGMLGYEPKELLGHPIDKVTGGSLKFKEEIAEKLIQDAGIIKNLETHFFLKSGSKMPVLFSAAAMRDSAGLFDKAVCVAQDLTWIKQAQETLNNNYGFQKILNSILAFSLQDASIDKLLEYSFNELLLCPGVYAGVLFTAADKPETLVMKTHHGIGEDVRNSCAAVNFGKCICGQAALNEEVLFLKSAAADDRHDIKHAYMPAHGHLCIPVRSSGRFIGLINLYVKEDYAYNEQELMFFKMVKQTLVEIIRRSLGAQELANAYTELSQTQSQLVQTAKMASIGQLAGGIAHEINNPLTGVLNNAQLIKIMLATSQDFTSNDFKELLDVIEESAQRCKKITESLLDFSHSSMGSFKEVSFNVIINKVAGLIHNELKLQNITVQSELENNLPEVQGDPQLLQQIIVNLVSNGKWAIEKKFGKATGGQVTLKTKFDADNKQVQVFVSDNGVGIPEDKIGKIFEPFFTTKQVGSGTGLGLYIVSNIIRKHKGTLGITSKVNEGTTFKISLPALIKAVNV